MFCTNCGSELQDDAKFCTNCGSAVSADSLPQEPLLEQAASEQSVAEQAARKEASAPSKRNKTLYIAVAIAAIIVIGVGSGIGYIALNQSNDSAGENTASSTESEQAASDEADATEESTDETQDTKTDESSDASDASSSADQTQNSSQANVQRQTALDFARCYWTNVYPAGSNNEGYTYNTNWQQDVLSYLAPNTNLYNEMINGEGAGFLDAEDYCTDVEHVSTQQSDGSGCETVKVYVAGHRQNSTANWISTYTHVYTMEIYFNTAGKITAFTTIYTDPSTGKVYTAEH